MSTSDNDRVLELLPEDGAPVEQEVLVKRSGLSWAMTSLAIVELACDGRVSTDRDIDGTHVRRANGGR